MTLDPIETRLRVVTWNVWWRYGPWERRRSAIEASLTPLGADVIALQEAWADGDDTQAAELARILGYRHAYQASEDEDGLATGNAVLSRWPIRTTDWRPLPGERESGERRCVLFAAIDGPNGDIPVFVSHLNWRRAHSHIRQRQITEIARFVASKSSQGFPPIVCGDFNAEPTSEEIRMMTGQAAVPIAGLVFRDAWADGSDGGAGYTWDNANSFTQPNLQPDRRIDYIFVGQSGARGAGEVVGCRLAGNEVVDGVWPSDHFALMAELRY